MSQPAYGFADPRPGGISPQRPSRRFGLVVSAEIVGHSAAAQRSALAGMLTGICSPLVPFSLRGESEIAGLLPAGADPMAVILPAMLQAGAPAARWAVVAGEAVLSPDHPGDFNGQALWRARALLEEGREEDRRLAIETGDPVRDARLAILGPWVGEWLTDLSMARRSVLRLLLEDPKMGPARAAAALGHDHSTRISKQAISQFLRHADTRRMRALIEIVRADATLPRPEGGSPAA